MGQKESVVLYLKKGVNISPLLHGGRSGIRFTLKQLKNIAGIAGFTAATEFMYQWNWNRVKGGLSNLRNKLIQAFQERFDGFLYQRIHDTSVGKQFKFLLLVA